MSAPPRDPLARLLLLVYPRRFRRRYGAELWRHHRRRHAERGGRLGRLGLYLALAGDSLANGMAARFEAARFEAARLEEPPPPRRQENGPRRSLVRRLVAPWLQELRPALRSLARRPAFVAVVVLTLALGLGVNAVLFQLYDGVVRRPLDYRQPERVVHLYGFERGRAEQRGTIAYLDFVDWVERTDVFATAAAYDEWEPNLTTGGRPQRLSAATVNSSFFAVLGVEPAAGRFFVAEEDVDGQDRVVVLSHDLWQRRFGGDPATVGSDVELNGVAHRVVGVAPAGFEDPRLSGRGFARAELWRPLGYLGVEPERLPLRGSSSYTAIARLAPGVGREEAEQRLAAVVADLEREHPETNLARAVRLDPLQEHLVRDVRPTLGLLLAAGGFLWLIAVANVANLLLGRAAERRREAAVRSALGAARGRLWCALSAEALLLTTVGTLLGVGAALAAIRGFAVRGGELLPRALPAAPTLATWFVVALLVVAALVCALVPSFFATRRDLRAPLAGRRAAGDRESTRLRGALVVAEVAVSIALLVGAGLLLRSFWSLSHVDPGVDVSGVLTFQLSLPGQDYPDATAVEAFFEELQPRLAALPGVDAVATANLLPLTGSFDCNTVSAAERPEPPHPESPCAETRTVTPSYFNVLGLRLLDGRVLDERDRADAPPVTVISRTLAATLWPGATAVGKRLRAFDGELEVVGVVDDVKHLRLDEPSPPRLFMSRGQSRAAWQGRRSTVLLRTAGEPTALLPSARETVWSLDDTLPTAAETTLDQVVSGSLAAERLRTLLITAFALAATLLAALGLYGVLAFLVAQRRYEMAVRLALGSRRGGVVRLVVGQGLALVAAGAVLGLAAAFALSHLLADLLYAVTPTDPVAFLAVALLMAAVGLVACWLPARRAASVDPAVALRG